MATIKSEMPPLHAAETLVGSVGTGGGSSSGGGGGGNNNNNSGNPTGTSAATTNNTSTTTAANNTISAAADSSDNQPSTPQPQIIGGNNEQQQNSSHHPYATHHMYSSTAAAAAAAAAANAAITTTAVGVTMPHMYGVGANSNTIYATAGQDMQQQQQQLQQQQQQHAGYSSYLNSYEQFYQQQAQQTQSSGMHTANGNSNLDYGNTGIMYGGAGGTAVGNLSTNTEYSSKPSGVRYHPYLQTPTSGLTSSAANTANTVSNNEGAHDTAQATSGGTLASSGAVSTTTSMSPRVVSSTSPTSTSSNHLQLGNSSSPSGKLQCKKCGIMSTNESELQEHITNVHGASPYGSSGYSSSPYIKEEMQTASTPHQQSSQPTQQQQTGGNPGDILDLDSQKMVYPPLPGGMPHMMHHPLGHQQMHDVSDPLHSMHTMQQRALPTWDQPAHSQLQEGLSPFMQQQHQQQQSQQEKTPLSNQSPYYSPKQSPYHISGGSGVGIKHEYPIIKSEYADSQNYVDKSFDPTSGGELCQQPTQQQSQNQQQMMPVSSSPAEFPSTTTGPQDQTQQYRGFEPPTSSSALPANSVTTKAASWKSNEARRPKTYNCTACNKWFTSSGHLKRHYNTTLHKNAVKSSGQPDPATMPISVHHHPSRDPGGKLSRRNNSNAAAAAAAAAQQQQQPPAPVQPPEPPRSPQDYVAQAAGLGQMSHYSASPSPTHHNQQQQNGMSYGQQSNGYQQQQFMQQVQSTTNASPQHASNISGVSPNTQTVLNGHPNGLAGPSAQTTPIPSSNTRGLLNTTTTTTVIAKIEPTEDNQTIIQSPMGMEMEMLQQQQQLDEETVEQLQLHQSQLEEQQMLEEDRQHLHYQQVESLEQHRHYHNSSHSSTDNMQAQSPLIISHQQYQEQLQQQQHQQMVDNIYSRITPPQPLQQAHMPLHNITDHQYNIMPLDINMPQHSSSMQLQQQPQHITTNTATTNTDSIHTMLHNHLHQRLVEQQELPHMHNTLLNNTSIQSPLDTSTIMHTPLPLPITTQQLLQQQQLTTHTIPSFQQLQQVSGLEQPGHTMTYHTIIGNQDGNSSIGSASTNSSELLQFTTLDGYGSMQSQQMVTSDGQILQFIPTQMTGQPLYTLPQRGSVAETYSPQSSFSEQRSPQEADLPPTYTFMQTTLPTQESSQTTTTDLPSMPYSPTISSSLDEYANNYSDTGIPMIKQEKSDFKTILSDSDSSPTTTKKTKTLKVTKAQKRKRTPSAGSISPSTSTSTTLPTGRIKCIECDKEFTKICYLTQHNKCFHSGEYPYRCQKCGKRFQSEEIYTTHLGRHKAIEKPHKCDLCPKQFHHKTDLRRHIEAIHTGLKQHSCAICEKSFCRKDHLRKHFDTHNRPRVALKKPVRTTGNRRTRGPNSPSASTSKQAATSTPRNVSAVTSRNTSAGTSKNTSVRTSRTAAASISKDDIPSTSKAAIMDRNAIVNTIRNIITLTNRDDIPSTSRDAITNASRNVITITSEDDISGTNVNPSTNGDAIVNAIIDDIPSTSKEAIVSVSRNVMGTTGRDAIAGISRNIITSTPINSNLAFALHNMNRTIVTATAVITDQHLQQRQQHLPQSMVIKNDVMLSLKDEQHSSDSMYMQHNADVLVTDDSLSSGEEHERVMQQQRQQLNDHDMLELPMVKEEYRVNDQEIALY